MDQIRRLTGIAVCLLLSGSALAESSATLWYDKPAVDWEKEALPIGNGRIGAMVFGGVASERLQVSEKSLWTGGPGTEGGYDYGLPTESQAALMGSIGKKLLDGATLTPEDVAKQLGRKMHNYGDYQSVGDLIIENAGGEGEVSDYRRELDLEAGVARVKFKQGMVGFRREYFVSYPDQVVVGRWYSTATQNLRVRFAVPDNRSAQTRLEASAKGGRLSVSGALKSNGLRYTAELLVIPECGTVTADGEALRVEGDCAVTFILSARTNYQMRYPEYRDPRADPAASARADGNDAAVHSYALLAQRHGDDHRHLYARVKLDLGAPAVTIPTDRLRASYGKGVAAADRALEQLYFNFGRYLLIAASRPGLVCPPTCRACGTTRPRRRGTPTITSTSICR